MTAQSPPLVEVSKVSKKFCRSLKRSLYYGVKDIGNEMLGRARTRDALRPSEFWAVRDLSLTVQRGSCAGLIGPNGSGKSTLLRMIGGLLKPDVGSITTRGRLMALINLGAGFNPVLTGRENIYISSSILGASKRETDRLIDEIVEFSGVADAIDAPVQSYSSGMKVRLGFSVAAHMDPDVLLLDEVLAVGDAAFRERCYRRIAQIKKQSAVVFVSHNMEQIDRICDQAVVMQGGKSVHEGETSGAILKYDEINSKTMGTEAGFLSVQDPISNFKIWLDSTSIICGSSLKIVLAFESKAKLQHFTLRLILYNSSGGFAADCDVASDPQELGVRLGENLWEISIPALSLRSGKYHFALNIIDEVGNLLVWSYKQQHVEMRGGNPTALSDYQLYPLVRNKNAD